MPFYSDTSDVREEAGNILPVDFSDDEIKEEQAAAYDFISSEIGEYNNDSPKIAAIKKLEIKLAASFVLDHFSQYKDKAKQKQDESYRLLDTLKKSLGPGGGADIGDLFSTTTYQSYSAAMSENREQTIIIPYSSMKPITSYGIDIGPEPYQKPEYYYLPIKTRPV
jgi:hypothetical protein